MPLQLLCKQTTMVPVERRLLKNVRTLQISINMILGDISLEIDSVRSEENECQVLCKELLELKYISTGSDQLGLLPEIIFAGLLQF